MAGYLLDDYKGTSYDSIDYGAPRQPSLLLSLCRNLVDLILCVAYVAASVGMVISNKYIMHPDRFPFPVVLTTMHMTASLLLGCLLYMVAPRLFPSAPAMLYGSDIDSRPRYRWYIVSAFAPIGLCGTLSIVCGTAAYMFAPISFLQIVKAGNIVCVYLLMLLFGLESFRVNHALVLVLVASCVSFATYRGVFSQRLGLALQIASGACQSLQVVLTNRLMSLANGPRVDPMTMVLFTAPVMLFCLVPLNMVFFESTVLQRMRAMQPLLLANVTLALTLQIISTLTVRRVAASGHALASMLKDVSIMTIAACVIQETISTEQLYGFVGSVIGVSLYSTMKLLPRGERGDANQKLPA